MSIFLRQKSFMRAPSLLVSRRNAFHSFLRPRTSIRKVLPAVTRTLLSGSPASSSAPSLLYTPKRFNFSYPSPRKLDELVRLEDLQKHSISEITQIWNAYHQSLDTAFGFTLSPQQYDTLMSRGAQGKFLTVPLFKAVDNKQTARDQAKKGGQRAAAGQGEGADGGEAAEAEAEAEAEADSLLATDVSYEVIAGLSSPPPFVNLLCQFQGSHYLMTSLEEFQKSPEAANPYMIFTFYDELKHHQVLDGSSDSSDSSSSDGDSGVVLVRCDITRLDEVTLKEANMMANLTLQRMYLDDGKYAQHVDVFNNKPREFNWDLFLADVFDMWKLSAKEVEERWQAEHTEARA